MKNFFNPCITYILLWCLYSLQGVLYESGTIISQSLLLILLVWSARSCYLVNFKKKQPLPAFIKAVNVFLIMATIYGSLLMLSGQEFYITEGDIKKVTNFYYLKDIYISMLPLYTFYYYSQKRYIKKEHLFYLLLLFVLITWALFFQNYANMLATAIAKGSTREEFTNNIGYSFVALFPLLLLCNKKPLLQYILAFICICGIIMSMKRGAMAVGTCCFIYFIYTALKSTKGYAKALIVLISIVAIIATYYYVVNMLETSDYFVRRINDTLEGNASARNIIYARLWNTFINEPNLLKVLFGRGANATLTVGINYAHNDWLELLTNQGILGVIVYINYFVAILKDARRLRGINTLYSHVLYISFFILFLKTIFSMSYASIEYEQMLAIGLALGATKQNCTV